MTGASAVGLVLAAGQSRRLGRPKQRLPWNGTTLLNHVIRQIHQAGCERVIVVLGFDHDAMIASIRRDHATPVQTIVNDDWRLGQSTSLRVGVSLIRDSLATDKVLIALCDQPRIDVTHYERLIESVCPDCPIAATGYQDGGGVPACFHASKLAVLLDRTGDAGAKGWIRRQPLDQVCLIACGEAIHDIDTPEDYAMGNIS